MSRITIRNGRRYREVILEAADTRTVRNHISAERPTGFTTAKEIREGRRAI